jgi:DNA-binding MarR family transcriptional regulator
MSTRGTAPPLAVGALLRFALQDLRARIYDGVVAAGFEDVRPSHVTLFRWPGPDGMRPTELADAVGITKQAVNELLRDLETLGYLHCRSDSRDSRARLIQLTGRGRRLHEAAVAAHSRIERDWQRTLGSARFSAFRSALERLVGESREVHSPRRPPN